MSIKSMTNQQHRDVLLRLLKLGESAEVGFTMHPAGIEYNSLMVCFLIHNLSAARSLDCLYDKFGEEWFPTSVGYAIVRPMFEIDITSHYITQDRAANARRYIRYNSILKKELMEVCKKHRMSQKADWREAMQSVWENEFAANEKRINKEFESVKPLFIVPGKSNKVGRNWSGKSIRQMAIDVDHKEAYDFYYADISSFTHADIRLADRFLRRQEGDLLWTARSLSYDVGSVFRYADIFLTCFMGLFGKEFGIWTGQDVTNCWNV
ncbi:MAG: hypothetical protein GYA46_04570 [candidate division Zixibacteria bacterium]|nr:hypothetical protein [candidate division Zixibacteria bacterium]